GAFRLLKLEDPNYLNKHTVLSPDCAVVLKDRWDSLTDEAKKILFPRLPLISLLSCVRNMILPMKNW
ncbi:22590_t:CDS:2, partial [Gigaspora rosea]